MRKALHTRCLKIRSPEWIYEYGDRAISVDDIKCGVRSADSLDNVTSSDLCQSPQGQGTGMTLPVHVKYLAQFRFQFQSCHSFTRFGLEGRIISRTTKMFARGDSKTGSWKWKKW